MSTSHHQSILRQLRECQSRSAREQQILSGRDWLIVTALVQFLTALYPVYRWFMDILMPEHAPETYQHNMILALTMIAMAVLLLALWGWAKFAPFRAACIALALFVAMQVYIVAFHPVFSLSNAASKILVLLGLIMAVRTGYRRRHSR